MLKNEILQKTFRFPIKKLIRNIFRNIPEGLEFQLLSKLYLIDNIVTGKKNSIQA